MKEFVETFVDSIKKNRLLSACSFVLLLLRFAQTVPDRAELCGVPGHNHFFFRNQMRQTTTIATETSISTG